jgi:histidinol phosphatase-like enzyme
MIIFLDIDETICTCSSSGDYSSAQPIVQAIEKANQLYADGHKIVYWTARGTVTGIDWREVTEKQFQKWGVKYHELRFGKPVFDIFIDDKNMNSKEWWNNLSL